MKKALLLNNQVVDVSDVEFEVAPAFTWMECSDECQTGWKLEGNTLVEFTVQEHTEIAIMHAQEVTDHISNYRDEKSENYPYKTTVIRLTDGARTDITATYYSVIVDQTIPDNKVMMLWQEVGYPDLPITAGDLRADGTSFMIHRQKCFTAASIVRSVHNVTPYQTKADVEEAFDNAYNS